jgi:hypothetical protein
MPRVRQEWALVAAIVVTAAGRGPAVAQPPEGWRPAFEERGVSGHPEAQEPVRNPYGPGGTAAAQAAPGAPAPRSAESPDVIVLPPPTSLGGPGTLPPPAAAPDVAAPPTPEGSGDSLDTPMPPGWGFPPPARPLPCGPRAKHNLQDCFLGYPEAFRSPPLGYFLYQNFRTEVANAEAARMVLYQYDFVDGGTTLNLHGQDKLARIAALLPRNFAPVVIERLPCAPGLAEARRLAVLDELAHGPFPVPPERVVVGAPIATGLSGVDAALVYENLLIQTQRQGVKAGLGGGSIGGTVGEGFSAPGRTSGVVSPGAASP